MFFSKSKNAFYTEELHGPREVEEVTVDEDSGEILSQVMVFNSNSLIPADAVEISDDEHQALLIAQSKGAAIVSADDGTPVAKYPDPLTKEELALVSFESIRHALQKEIDLQAKNVGFSSGNALILYAGFGNPFQLLAKDFAKWEAQVWFEAGEYRDAVAADKKPMLTAEDAVAMMPELLLE